MDTAATGDTFDISNNDRLGKSEVRIRGSHGSTSAISDPWICGRAGGAGPAADRRGQLSDREREEAGERTRRQSPSSSSPVQEINLDWCQEPTQMTNRSPAKRFLLYSSRGKTLTLS